MPKEESVLNTPQFSLKELLEVINANSEANQRALLEAIKEMKKPNEYEQRKIDAEELKLKKAREMRRAEMLAEENVRLAQQRVCQHKRRTKDGLASGWAGQVNADGYIRFICVNCQMVAPEVKAPIEWVQNGVNCQDPNGPLYHLTLEQIQQWHVMYGPKPKVPPRGSLEAIGA